MTATSWWVLVNFEQQGPWPESHVSNAAAAGQLGPESLVWCVGMPEWAPLRTTPLGQRLFPARVTPPPPPVPTPRPAPPVASTTERTAPISQPAPRTLTAGPVDANDIADLLDALDAEAVATTGHDDTSHTGQAAEAAGPSMAQEPIDPATTCPYCHTTIGAEIARRCPTCAAPHHADCWHELTGCAVVGCEAGPDDSRAATPQQRPATDDYVVNATPGMSAGWTSSGPRPGLDATRGNW